MLLADYRNSRLRDVRESMNEQTAVLRRMDERAGTP